MKSFAVNRILTGLVVTVGLASGVLVAQTPTKIGTINLQAAVPNTAEAKAATDKIQREFIEPRTAQLKQMQQLVQDAQDKLARGGNTLSETAKADLQAEVNRKTKEFNRAVEDFNADRDDRERELLADFSTKMQAVVVDYARANGFALIFDTGNRDQSGLVYNADSIDVTQAIVEAYDKSHPVTGGAPAAPAAAKPAAVKPKASPAK